MKSGAVFLLLMVVVVPVVGNPRTSVFAAAEVSYTLYGSSAEGWGFEPTDQNMTIPGPDITVVQGETVQLTLTAVLEPPPFNVTFPHDFGVDYDRDCDPSNPPCQPSSGEPYSGFFGDPYPSTITYTFTVNAPIPDTYTYYCYIHAGTMLGRFIVEPGISPTAGFNYAPASPTVGQNVTFDASSSFDQDGTIESYEWSFGDGGVGTGITIQHAYLNPGIYTATLTVKDNTDLTNSVSRSINVTGTGNSAPIANFTFAPSTPMLGQRVDFDASSSQDPDPGDGVVSYSWDFGDGTTLADRTESQTSHTYRTFGIMQVTLNVTDSHGLLGQSSPRQIVVLPVRNIAVTGLVVTPPSVETGTEVVIEVSVNNLGNVTEVLGIQLMWNSTQITNWSTTLSAAGRSERSYNWTPPNSGVFIITARALVSLDDQNSQDNEKTVSLTVKARAPGLPAVFYWSLAGASVAAVGASVYFYTKKTRRLPTPQSTSLSTKPARDGRARHDK